MKMDNRLPSCSDKGVAALPCHQKAKRKNSRPRQGRSVEFHDGKVRSNNSMFPFAIYFWRVELSFHLGFINATLSSPWASPSSALPRFLFISFWVLFVFVEIFSDLRSCQHLFNRVCETYRGVPTYNTWYSNYVGHNSRTLTNDGRHLIRLNRLIKQSSSVRLSPQVLRCFCWQLTMAVL